MESIIILKLSKTTMYLLGFFLFLSCASQQVVTNSTEIQEKSKLLFLNYNIVKIDSTSKNITLISQKTTEGKLKNTSKAEIKTSIGDLECISLDKDFNEIEKKYIKNPLVKIVEFVNDLGNFEKKILDLDSAQFSLRLQLPPKAKHIVISELTQNGNKKHITTKIN